MKIKGEGLTYKSLGAADPGFYQKKRKIEQKLGKQISTKEFIEKYYEIPTSAVSQGTSIFDPVLCETVYTWFTNFDDKILDPFAGGSVRGLVATTLGRHYIGVDLSEEQVETNRQNANFVLPQTDEHPTWICGDSLKIDELVKGKFDFVFTCPPYGDLEQYTDDEKDLSNMSIDDFDETYKQILKKTIDKLEDDRFLCIVVGNYRDKEGYLIDLAGKTIRFVEEAGARYYNDVILRTPVSSASLRASVYFPSSRKIARIHQYVLIFVKGNPKKATERLTEINSQFLDKLLEEFIEKGEKINERDEE